MTTDLYQKPVWSHKENNKEKQSRTELQLGNKNPENKCTHVFK
jgi:hypothetical protein